jgi:hypothetical protein
VIDIICPGIVRQELQLRKMDSPDGYVGPTQIGLVRKSFGAKLSGNNPVAFEGEAGYQAELLMPGLRFKFCLIYDVTKHLWVQVPAGQIGVVIAQVALLSQRPRLR